MTNWSKEHMLLFENDPNIGVNDIYADLIMRPMALSLCKDVLEKFDRDWNSGKEPLGPNWNAFASELEMFIKKAHKENNLELLHKYYSFLNWAVFEKTSYLHKEAFVSPIEGLLDFAPAEWMKYLPIIILDEILNFSAIYFSPNIIIEMKKAKNMLLNNPSYHSSFWVRCHEEFTEIAKANSIPYTNLLVDK